MERPQSTISQVPKVTVMTIRNLIIICTCISLATACDVIGGAKAPSDLEEVEGAGKGFATVKSVTASGVENSYTFSVEVESPDTGCEQYADWWEVIDSTGHLKYRRILLHSHVNEQPFRRTGGPVPIDRNEFVYVRAHMNNTGFGTQVMAGSVQEGFETVQVEEDFAKELATQEPLPDDCDF